MKLIILDDDESLNELQTEENVYIIAKKGFYIKKKNNMYEALLQVDKFRFLKDINEKIIFNLHKLPLFLLEDCNNFFRDVYKHLKSEAIVLLYYDFDTNQYFLEIPYQEVSCSSIDYKFPTLETNWKLVGSIHSHPVMGAFQSDTDYFDEKYFEGIHITLSFNKDINSFSIHIRLSILGNMFETNEQNVIQESTDTDALNYNHQRLSKENYLKKCFQKDNNVTS